MSMISSSDSWQDFIIFLRDDDLTEPFVENPAWKQCSWYFVIVLEWNHDNKHLRIGSLDEAHIHMMINKT